MYSAKGWEKGSEQMAHKMFNITNTINSRAAQITVAPDGVGNDGYTAPIFRRLMR